MGQFFARFSQKLQEHEPNRRHTGGEGDFFGVCVVIKGEGRGQFSQAVSHAPSQNSPSNSHTLLPSMPAPGNTSVVPAWHTPNKGGGGVNDGSLPTTWQENNTAPGTSHGSRVRKAPAVGVEQWHHGQHGFRLGQPKAVGHALCVAVQHVAAVGV